MGCLNVCGCSTIDSKTCEIGCMFGRRGMDVLALCETKMPCGVGHNKRIAPMYSLRVVKGD